jgi:hypothetical protein
MIDHSRRTGAAIEAHYQFLVWLMPTVGKFPRSHYCPNIRLCGDANVLNGNENQRFLGGLDFT